MKLNVINFIKIKDFIFNIASIKQISLDYKEDRHYNHHYYIKVKLDDSSIIMIDFDDCEIERNQEFKKIFETLNTDYIQQNNIIDNYRDYIDKMSTDYSCMHEENKMKDKIIEAMAYELSEEDENFQYRNISDITEYFKKKIEG